MPKKEKARSSFKTAESQHSYKWIDTDKLEPYANNAKQHPVWQVNQIEASIVQFGFITPIIINHTYEIIAGHGRYAAALKLGLKQVPTIMVHTLTDAEVKAYRIADNQLSMNTGHDMDLLRVELSELDNMDLNFDLEITGLSTGEIDIILNSADPHEDDHADIIPEAQKIITTQSGDRWIMGKHVLLCGNSLDAEGYEALMQGEVADAVFSDPPYNCPVSGHVCGNGKIKHDEFAMASGEMSDEEFQSFLAAIIALLIAFSKDGSLHYLCIDWRNIYTMIAAAEGQYSELKNICIWNKSNAGMGSLYRSKHEFIPVFKNGTAKHTNNVELGKHGRFRSNVWDYPSVNTFGGTKDLEMHPTVKPAAMIADAIMDCTSRGEVILDPFGGSGSTLIAAEMTGRAARLIEIEPKYCDVTIRRWQDYTGEDAVHADTGKTFNETMQKGELNHG